MPLSVGYVLEFGTLLVVRSLLIEYGIASVRCSSSVLLSHRRGASFCADGASCLELLPTDRRAVFFVLGLGRFSDTILAF